MAHTVLFVDDNPQLLEGIRRTLRREPYDVLVATSGARALRVLAERPVDLVVSDENMPGMSGTAFLGRVRAEYPKTIRILLAGHGDFEVAVRAINQGEVYRFFTKPCNAAELGAVIRGALQQKDLLVKSRRLLQTVKRQSAVLEEIELTAPGLTRVSSDEDGTIVINEEDVPDDLDALLKEVEAELDAAEERLRKRERKVRRHEIGDRGSDLRSPGRGTPL
jgi:two-component system probable response regulator PhcQ